MRGKFVTLGLIGGAALASFVVTAPSTDAFAQSHSATKAEQPKLNIFQKFFPSLRPKDDYFPYETLKAPFAHEDTPSSGLPAFGFEDDYFKRIHSLQKGLDASSEAVPIHLPHTRLDDISNWALTEVSAALTFPDGDYASLKKVLTRFAPTARKQYVSFLSETGILSKLKSKSHRINTILREQPLLINEAEAGGRYKWVFDIDLLTTYLPVNAKNYRNTAAKNDKFNLRVQLTRAPSEENPHDGLLIEIWTVK